MPDGRTNQSHTILCTRLFNHFSTFCRNEQSGKQIWLILINQWMESTQESSEEYRISNSSTDLYFPLFRTEEQTEQYISK